MENNEKSDQDAVRPVHEIANKFLAIGLKQAITEMLDLRSDPYEKQIDALRQCMTRQQLQGEAERRMEAVINAVMDERARARSETLDNIAVAILSIVNEYRVPLQMKT